MARKDKTIAKSVSFPEKGFHGPTTDPQDDEAVKTEIPTRSFTNHTSEESTISYITASEDVQENGDHYIQK